MTEAEHIDIYQTARNIINMDTTYPFGLGGYYEHSDWMDAAVIVLEDGYTDEFEFMLAREAAWERYKTSNAKKMRDGGDEYECFETWCAEFAPEACLKYPLVPKLPDIQASLYYEKPNLPSG